MRSSVALIYTAIAVIAVCMAAVIYRLTPLPLEMAALFGVTAFFAMATLDQAAARRSERLEFRRQLTLNDEGLQDAFNEIDMIRSRMVSLETDAQQTVDQGVAPVFQDLQAIGALLAQVTEAVSDTDHRLVTIEEQMKKRARRRISAQGTQALPDAETSQEAEAPAAVQTSEELHGSQISDNHPEPQSQRTSDADPEPQADVDAAKEKQRAEQEEKRSKALLKRVKTAVEGEQVEVALQSIVTLPLRRARGYSTVFSLKLAGAGKLEARHAIPAIEAAGMSEEFDKAALRRALALADRFATRDSTSMVFAPVSGAALMKSQFADWLVKQLTADKELAGQLVLEIPQKDVQAFTPLDYDLMGALTDLGFRMCVSQVIDTRSDLFALSGHGFRYAKVPVSLFLGSDAQTKGDIHPEDLSDLAARNGMDLIVDQVESESQVVELLDCKLKYGQGNLFARPRAVDIMPRDDASELPPQRASQAVDDRQKEPMAEAGFAPKAPDRRAVRGLSRSA
jgi:cyclic-di-GMP phosphodiesterase TipF (flagellum assembly factor)